MGTVHVMGREDNYMSFVGWGLIELWAASNTLLTGMVTCAKSL